MTDATVTVSQNVLNRLRTRGWCRRGNGPPEGPNCLGGALYFAMIDEGQVDLTKAQHAAYTEVTTRWSAIIKTLFPERASSYQIITFNDARVTTFADIEQVLVAAAAEEERLDAPPLRR